MSQSISMPAKGKLLTCEFLSAPASSRKPAIRESGLLQTSIVNGGASLSPIISSPETTVESLRGLFGAANAVGSFERNAIPWDKIADWTHGLEKTSTDHWMDFVDGAVRGPNHRWLRHNPVDFLQAWLRDTSGKLKIADYIRHISLDVITTKGLPILPQAVHELLLKAGIPFGDLVAFTHLNVFDLTVGTFAIAEGSRSLFLALTGHLPWNGVQTFLFTFGTGSLEIAAGLGEFTAAGLHCNPFLLTAGAMQMSAGAISLYQHWMMPDPSLFELALPYLLRGAEAGALASVIRLALCWNRTTAIQRVEAGAETMLLSVSSSLLGAVSSWLAVPVSLGYGFSKFAWKLAEQDSHLFEQSRVSSPVSFALAIDSLLKNGGPDAVDSFRQYLINSERIENLLAPKFFEDFGTWDRPPTGTEHILADQSLTSVEWASDEIEQSNCSLPEILLSDKDLKI